MRTVLRDIRAVSGVTGVAVMVKRDGRAEHFFPAAFTERHTSELLKMVTAAYQRLRGFSRLQLRFDRVTVHLINQPEFLLFVTTLPDIDETLFQTVVSSKLPTVARMIATQDTAERGSGRGAAGAHGFNPAVFDVLLDGCNSVTRRLASKTGLSRLSTGWRAARDAAITRNPALASIEVDAAGHLSVRKGRSLPPTAATIQAIAHMIESFMDGVATLRPDGEDAMYNVFERHHDLLESHGYFHYAKTLTGTVRSH